MDGDNKTFSSDFTLTGLFTHSKASGFLFSILCLIFFMALMANGFMIFLICRDSHLHTPMYFLLSQLSFIDMLYISTIVPKMLVDYLLGKGTISFMACTAQHFLYMGFVGAEFFLLGLMAYDRYVAICSPLTYTILMSPRVCWVILASSWFGGALDSFILTPITMSLPFCASHKINHFFCEAPTMLRLACGDKVIYEMVMYICCVMMLLIPFSVVTASYTQILITVHQMKSIEGKKKAFATCSSHMMVVTLFYGAALYTYMLPQSYHTPIKDKIFSAFYTILTPLLNPLIYSLRNRDVTEAFKRVLASCRGACGREGAEAPILEVVGDVSDEKVVRSGCRSDGPWPEAADASELPHSTAPSTPAPPAPAQGPARGLRSGRHREETPEEEPSSSTSAGAPILPVRALGGTGPDGEHAYQYWPLSSSDLYNWKAQNPSFSEDPKGLTDLFESVMHTHSPTWDDCQQLLKTLFTTKECERILT
nr:PREDICTED: olfactory receptor 2T6-like [Rhinolophus sinicus]